jgi:hypothetical protein
VTDIINMHVTDIANSSDGLLKLSVTSMYKQPMMSIFHSPVTLTSKNIAVTFPDCYGPCIRALMVTVSLQGAKIFYSKTRTPLRVANHETQILFRKIPIHFPGSQTAE